MHKPIFSFKKQFYIGDGGEDFFLECYKGSRKENGREYDIIYRGKKVELKSDGYSMKKTNNFFMERYGNIETKKEGGPWRSANDKVDFFVYLFLQDRTFFWFRPKELVKYLNSVIKDMEFKTIQNKNHTSLGYLIDRDSIKDLILKKQVF